MNETEVGKAGGGEGFAVGNASYTRRISSSGVTGIAPDGPNVWFPVASKTRVLYT